MQDEMRCQTRVLVRWIIGISEQKSVPLSGKPDGRFLASLDEIYPRIEFTYGPSDHVKTWLNPHDSTSFSASFLGLGIVFLVLFHDALLFLGIKLLNANTVLSMVATGKRRQVVSINARMT